MNPITVALPASNTAEEWNAQIKEAAEKAGVELPKPGAAAVEVPVTKKDDEPVIYRAALNVNGKEMVFEDKDPAAVLRQYTTAVEAAQLQAAPAAAAATVEEKKPAFTEAEMFDITLGLQKGDVKVLENYIEKSGLIDRYLESKGVKVDELKAAVTDRQSNSLNDQWKTATDAFGAKVKAGEIDYPGGAQNTYLMGIMLAELGLRDKPSVESFELAYAELKKRNMIFPVTASTATAAGAAAAAVVEVKPKKEAPGSTAIGTHGHEKENLPAIDPKRRFELNIKELTPRQYTESYNELISSGVKKEQIVIIS